MINFENNSSIYFKGEKLEKGAFQGLDVQVDAAARNMYIKI